MRLLVTGAAGMVGSYVRRVFSDAEVILTDIRRNKDYLDVRNIDSVVEAVREARPDVLLHLAAATDVDRCEQDPSWAYHNNATGTMNVVRACEDANCVLIYLSTGAVFAGDKPDPYTEFDDTSPCNVYARSKLAGENAVRERLRRYYIVRAGWMFGGVGRDAKFVGKISGFLRQGKRQLNVVNDKYGSPTYASDLLLGVRRLLDTEYYGLFHMANPGMCSRYEVAEEIVRLMNLEGEVELSAVSSAYFPLPAPRGRSEALDNFKLSLLRWDFMRPWQQALKEYLQQELLTE